MKRLLMLTIATLAVSSMPLSAAKTVFERTKPHVNVGTIGGASRVMWIHSTILLEADGNATGQVQFSVLDGENYFYRVVGAEAIISGDEVIGLDVTLARVGDSGDDSGELHHLTIRRSSASEDCLIYDVLGPDIHLEAEGTIELLHPVSRMPVPPLRGSRPAPPPQQK